ncbi:hypothetical protein [Siminovitchia fortis]|nr:hypothetical protein [Siminovitchia fortis]
MDVGMGMRGVVFGMVGVFIDRAKLLEMWSFLFIGVIALRLFGGEKRF